MNDSGSSILAVKFFKVPLDRPSCTTTSTCRPHDCRRLGGGLAGHNGLRSIAQRLGLQEFLRLRIGVGRPERGDPRPVADYVLSPFAPEDDVDAIVGRAADAVECLLAEGLEETQRRFN